ncbi:GYD domain-containing protein [Candidatus Borrarchaeum sp.]|uniref:GYD domain-containing protein n=1 Tax=Candidatus Borrarchaeum sp. TaxID=2846742 RepID=UPI0025799D45|nr:GYD domain-containing protein [Candidatus Borrarchaeum sp.]
MPTFICLMNYTEQGIRTIKDSPKRIEEGIKLFEDMGGKLVAIYSTQGEYDLIAVGEAPSDEIATTFTLRLASLGNIRTTTLKAFTVQSSMKDDPAMPTFVLFMKFTDMGIRRVKDSPGRIEEAIQGWDALGGKLIGLYTVLGDIDLMAIGDAPNDEAVIKFILKLGSVGNVRTKTFRVFTKEEFTEMVNKLP